MLRNKYKIAPSTEPAHEEVKYILFKLNYVNLCNLSEEQEVAAGNEILMRNLKKTNILYFTVHNEWSNNVIDYFTSRIGTTLIQYVLLCTKWTTHGHFEFT